MKNAIRSFMGSLLAGALVAATLPLWAANPNTQGLSQGAMDNSVTNPSRSSNVSPVQGTNTALEKEVLEALHKTNEKEIQIGQLAETQAQSSAVRDYGKMLASD